jgi:hypothetical protein
MGFPLWLTLLVPDIVEAILGGWHPVGLQLNGLRWREQRATFLG